MVRIIEDLDQKYLELCNFFWYLLHPACPIDTFPHTSDECRKLAREVFEILGIR